MKIESQNDFRIAVKLSKDDLTELDITYDELDYANIETRRVLWTVLDEARQVLGREINISERMMIEAVPETDGGCSIFFTVLPKSGKKDIRGFTLKKGQDILVCELKSADDLINLAGRLYALDNGIKSSLHMENGAYRLVACPDLKDFFTVEAMFAEYGELLPQSDLTVAKTRERWKTLADGDAARQLAGL